MKRFAITMSIALTALAAIAGTAPPDASITQLAWLERRWVRQSKARTVEEQWLAPLGNSMVGIGRTVDGDSLIEYELVIIREHGSRLAYEAHPSGQPTAVFLSTSVGDSGVVFENLEHDFPQRVGYQRLGADELMAWIEGTRDGKTRRVDFPYRRAAAPR